MVDASATMVYELRVGMTCGGCSSAIQRILGSKPGKNFYSILSQAFICLEITKVHTDVATKQVLVEG